MKGPSVKVNTFDTQRDLTARQAAHNCCPCTHGKGMGPYHSREPHMRYLFAHGMAINEHQLAESSIGEGLYAVVLMLCSCFSRRSAAAAALRGGVCRCPLMISSFAARAGLVLALLARRAELFLLHAANCVEEHLL